MLKKIILIFFFLFILLKLFIIFSLGSEKDF